MKKIFNKYHLIKLCLFIMLFISITICTVAYSALNTNLTLIDSKAVFRPIADIRIVDFKYLNASNGAAEEYSSEFSKQNIFLGIVLPDLKSTITYEITLTNFVDIEMIFRSVNNLNYNNPNVEYMIENLPEIISGVSTKTFQITFKYKEEVNYLPEKTNLGANIEFIFTPNDNEPPVINEITKPKVFFLTQTDEVDLTNYVTAYDEIDGDLTSKIESVSIPEFNKNEAGTYKIIYNVSDIAGNQATYSIEIVVWNFIKIVNGQYHGLALTSHGQVWTWGWNGYGQRGMGTSIASASTAGLRAPSYIDQSYFGDLPIVDIAAGYNSSYVVNSEGQAYSWGEGSDYQLGIGSSLTNQNKPVMVSQGNVKFTKISSFYRTVAALSDDGNIYTWGRGDSGASGSGLATNKNVPSAITTTGDFVKISQGYYGGSAINNKGEVYVWGSNINGEIGIGTSSSVRFTPTLNPTLSEFVIKDISYGLRHILALTDNGDVYSWGMGSYGRLCNSSSSSLDIPTLITKVSNVEMINTGYDFSQLKVGNNIYSCGNNNYGELFDGKKLSSNPSPNLSNLDNIFDNVGYMAGRYNNAYILSKDGTMLWGIGFCDSEGQEWGSIVNESTSMQIPVPWTFIPPDPY